MRLCVFLVLSVTFVLPVTGVSWKRTAAYIAFVAAVNSQPSCRCTLSILNAVPSCSAEARRRPAAHEQCVSDGDVRRQPRADVLRRPRRPRRRNPLWRDAKHIERLGAQGNRPKHYIHQGGAARAALPRVARSRENPGADENFRGILMHA